MTRLDNWSIVVRTENPFQAPELGSVCMQGEIYNDDRFEDGESVTTGCILYFDSVAKIAKTRRTEYQLGDIDSTFEAYLEENEYSISDYDVDKGEED